MADGWAGREASFYARCGKRALDLLAAAFGLVLVSPVLLVCAVLVRLTSRGPVFFRKTCPGRYGQPFRVFKFRTMRQGADQLGLAVAVPGDPRVTLVGRLLRRTKLDELPQIINVLLGDMSLVGPRPRAFPPVNLDNPEERALLSVRPGVTSYASIYHRMEGDYCAKQEDPQATHLNTILPQKSYLDGQYLKEVSFALDLKLIFLTCLLVFLPGKAEPRTIRFFGLEVRTYNQAAQIVLETIVFSTAVWLAYWLRFEGQLPDFYRWQRAAFILLIPLARLATNMVFGIYDMIWRYVNLVDAVLVASSLSVPSAVLLATRLLLPPNVSTAHVLQLPLGVIATEFFLVLGGSLGLRALRRALYEMNHRYQPLPTERGRRILIWGAGLSGTGIALELGRYPHLRLVGFVDDDPAKQGHKIAGYRVLGKSNEVSRLVREHTITDLIVCASSVEGERLRQLSSQWRGLGVKVHIIPTLDQILGSDQHVAVAGVLPSVGS